MPMSATALLNMAKVASVLFIVMVVAGCETGNTLVSRHEYRLELLSHTTYYEGVGEIKDIDEVLDTHGKGRYDLEGVSLAQKGHLPEALVLFDKAVAEDPKDTSAIENKIGVLLYLKRFDEALAECDRLISVKPDDEEGYLFKIALLQHAGKDAEAVAFYNEHVDSKKPKDAEKFVEKGNDLRYLGRFADALACYDKAIELKPADPSAYDEKGVTMRLTGRLDESIKLFDKAMSVAPQQRDSAYTHKGYSLIELGRYDEAVSVFDKVTKAAPNDFSALDGKGYALTLAGRYDEALPCLTRALTIDKADRETNFCMALALKGRGKGGDAKDAAAIFDKLLKENDKDLVALYTYAVVGRKDDMLALARKVVDIDPTLKLELKRDREFKAYRKDPEFMAVVAP